MKRPFLILFGTNRDHLIPHPGISQDVSIRHRYALISILVTVNSGMALVAGFLLAGRDYKTLISSLIVLLVCFAVILITVFVMIIFHAVFKTQVKEIERQTEASLNDQLLKKINALLDKNIDDPQFGILQLCRAMGLSRAQMYRKFRGLNDRTLHDYIRYYKLKRAKDLLLSSSLNVSEVAYGTGFTNVSHFSRIFNEEFGRHPRDFRKKLNLLT